MYASVLACEQAVRAIQHRLGAAGLISLSLAPTPSTAGIPSSLRCVTHSTHMCGLHVQVNIRFMHSDEDVHHSGRLWTSFIPLSAEHTQLDTTEHAYPAGDPFDLCPNAVRRSSLSMINAGLAPSLSQVSFPVTSHTSFLPHRCDPDSLCPLDVYQRPHVCAMCVPSNTHPFLIACLTVPPAYSKSYGCARVSCSPADSVSQPVGHGQRRHQPGVGQPGRTHHLHPHCSG